VNRSPRCSTASRMSEKFLAASVALTSVTTSDYLMSPRNYRRPVISYEHRRKNRGNERATEALAMKEHTPQRPKVTIHPPRLVRPGHGLSALTSRSLMVRARGCPTGDRLRVLSTNRGLARAAPSSRMGSRSERRPPTCDPRRCQRRGRPPRRPGARNATVSVDAHSGVPVTAGNGGVGRKVEGAVRSDRYRRGVSPAVLSSARSVQHD
jgi:hypothetical protein